MHFPCKKNRALLQPTTELNVTMTCSGCSNAVTRALNKLDGESPFYSLYIYSLLQMTSFGVTGVKIQARKCCYFLAFCSCYFTFIDEWDSQQGTDEIFLM
jgi:copper chaperone CopZ